MKQSVFGTQIVSGTMDSNDSSSLPLDHQVVSNAPIDAIQPMTWREISEFATPVESRVLEELSKLQAELRGASPSADDAATCPDRKIDIETIIADFEKNSDRLRAAFNSQQDQWNETLRAKRELRSEIDRYRQSIDDERRQCREVASRLEIAQHHLAVVGSEREQMQDQIESLRAELELENQRASLPDPQLIADIERLESTVTSLGSEVIHWKNESESLANSLANAKEELEQIRAQRNVIRNELESLQRIHKQDNQHFERTLGSLQVEKEQLENTIAGFQQKAKIHDATLARQDQLEAALASARQKLNDAELNFAQQSKLLDAANEKLLQLSQNNDGLRQENALLATECEKHEQAIDDLVAERTARERRQPPPSTSHSSDPAEPRKGKTASGNGTTRNIHNGPSDLRRVFSRIRSRDSQHQS